MTRQREGKYLAATICCGLMAATAWGQQVPTSASELDPEVAESMQPPADSPVIEPMEEAAPPAPVGEGISGSVEIRPRDESRVTIPIEMVTADGGCTLLDFEGLGDQEPIGVIPGAITVTFAEEWLSIIDADAGGSGNFANEPSPDTIAFFLEDAGPINFSTGVQYIEIHYVAAASSIPVTLNAWSGPNGTGILLDSEQGNTVGTSGDGADCEGDPTGTFCLWDRIVLTAPGNDIQSISLAGAVPNFIGFDNLELCTDDPIVGACCLPDGRCAETTRQNCNNQGGQYHGDNTRCRNFNCRLGSCCNGKECSVVEPQDCDGTFNGFGSDCDPNPCVGACCLPGVDTGCGIRPGDCFLTRGPGCDDVDGTFHGLGSECEQDLRIINHNGPREQWSHEIVTSSICEENPLPEGGCVDCANNFYDPWTTAEPVGGGNCEDFAHEDSCPIPADFFGPGSEPFSGEVCFKGEPLGVQQVPGCGGPLDFATADTIVRRFAEPFTTCDAPLNQPVDVEIVMERLHLTSCRPITIQFGGEGCVRDPEWQCDGDTDGDGQVNPVDSGLVQAAFGSQDPADLCQYDMDCDGQINPVDSGIVQSLFGSCDPPRDECDGGGGGREEEWDVEVVVDSSNGQPSGTLTARKQHCNGGIFNSTLPVCPTFVFTKVSDPNEQRFLDFCDVCDPNGIIMNATAVPWVVDAGNANGIVSPVCSDFHPGLEEQNPRSDCNCDGDGIHDDCEADRDGDEVIDDCDNCPDDENPEQEDRDNDDIGDVCDECPDDPGDDCRGACCVNPGPCDWDNGLQSNGVNGRALSPPNFPDIRVADDFRFTRSCAVSGIKANVIEDANWTDGGSVEVCVYEDTRGNGPGAIVDCQSRPFGKVATGDQYFGRDGFDYHVTGLAIPLSPGSYWVGIRNPGGGGSGTNYWMTSDAGSDGPGLGTAWFSLNGGSTWNDQGAGWHQTFELQTDSTRRGAGCNWDNNLQPNGVNARAISPPNFPDIRVADDFHLAAPCTVRQIQAGIIEDAGWTDGGDITVLIYRDSGGAPGLVIAGGTTSFTKTATGDQYFGRDGYEYSIDNLNINLAAGSYWLGLRNPRGGGSGTNYWLTSDGGGDGIGSSGGYLSLDAGNTWNPEGAGWHHAFELGIGDGGCEDITESECDDLAGTFNRGQTCEEGPCNGACCVVTSGACDWNNGLQPNGVNARALSPPNFPDIRVADDVVLDSRCEITELSANVIEDAGWTNGGSVTVEVRANAGGSPGAIVASHVGGFSRVATGDQYFGRDGFDYTISGMSLNLPAGTYWIGFRNPGGGGSGTNYWMTSDGGSDGPGSSTGHFSLNGGTTWSDEGAGWHHAFEIATRGRACVQTTEPECRERRGHFAFGVDCQAGICDDGACCLSAGCLWDNGLQPNGTNARALSPPNFPDIRVADDFRIAEPCDVSRIRAGIIEDAGWTRGASLTVEVRANSGNAPGAVVASRVSPYAVIATGDQYFGRDGFEYTINPAPIALAPGTYWLTIRNHLGSGSGTNYWLTSDAGSDGPGVGTGHFSLDGGSTWSDEGAGWHHAFELEGSGECRDLFRGECIVRRGDFSPGVECADGPCRLCDDCDEGGVDVCGGDNSCHDCETPGGACACVAGGACNDEFACPNGQSDCNAGQICCTNTCCGFPICLTPCGAGPQPAPEEDGELLGWSGGSPQ